MCHLQLHINKTGTYCNIIDLVSEQHNLPVCNTSEQYVEVMKCIFNKLLSDTPWFCFWEFFFPGSHCQLSCCFYSASHGAEQICSRCLISVVELQLRLHAGWDFTDCGRENGVSLWCLYRLLYHFSFSCAGLCVCRSAVTDNGCRVTESLGEQGIACQRDLTLDLKPQNYNLTRGSIEATHVSLFALFWSPACSKPQVLLK